MFDVTNFGFTIDFESELSAWKKEGEEEEEGGGGRMK
jgi:hypothetical protein